MIKVLAIPDLHFPFHNKKALYHVIEFIKEHKPKFVINLGDIYDAFSFSRHLKNKQYINPMDELILARKYADKMWQTIQKFSPKSRCIQLGGNHCTGRMAKLALEKAPEFYELAIKTNKDLMTFKGVKTFHSQRDYYEVDNVIFTHGTYTQPYKHVMHYNKSVVFGHLHRGWVLNLNRYDTNLFEMCCGHLADTKNEEIFSYMPTKINNWQLGFGVIDDYGPRFISL